MQTAANKLNQFNKEEIETAVKRAIEVLQSDVTVGVHLDLLTVTAFLVINAVITFFFWNFQPWQQAYKVVEVQLPTNSTLSPSAVDVEDLPPQKLTIEVSSLFYVLRTFFALFLPLSYFVFHLPPALGWR